MARLTTRQEDTLSTGTLELLDPTRFNGRIADVYLQFANSEHALAAYMQMEASLKKSGLTEKELEAVKLLVSQINNCEYCLSVHTMKAKRLGISAEEIMAIRAAKPIDDGRLNVILTIVQHFFTQRAPLPDSLIEEARRQSISDEALVDLAMAVSTIFFTNITNHINDTQPTLPPAPPLD